MNRKLIKYLIVIFMLLPFSYFFMWSFVERWNYGEAFPKVFSIRAWKHILESNETLKIILNSSLLSILVAAIATTFCYLPAKTLALDHFKLKNLFRLILFTPIVLPVTAIAIGLHLNFLRLGLANNVFGVILVHVFFCIPYCILALEPVMSSVGINYNQQAMLLGASPFKTFKNIELPLYLPGIIVSFFYSFIVSFSQYFLTFLIGGGKVKTYSMLIFPIIREKDRHESAIYSIIFIIICLFVYSVLFMIKKFIEKRYYD